jgi:RimJ/RimL family protein N-acetyltransferase
VELLLTDARAVRHLFAAEHLALVIEAVIAGSFRATVWVDDPAAPRTALAWDGSHGIYLVGAVDRPEEWRELLAREVLPAGHGLFKANVPDDVAAVVFAGYELRRRDRVFYRAPDLPAEGERSSLPDGLRISEIAECLDDLVGLANAAEVVAEIEFMWPSLDAFRRDGFGFAAHDGSTVAGWCTAEYVSPGRCGIGIETVAAFQRRGIATATARAFLTHCTNIGLTPHWDAWATNRPSVAVAERIGLTLVETYHVHIGDFGDGNR